MNGEGFRTHIPIYQHCYHNQNYLGHILINLLGQWKYISYILAHLTLSIYRKVESITKVYHE